MNKIKSLLAFAAVLLCGGAWAANEMLYYFPLEGDLVNYGKAGNVNFTTSESTCWEQAQRYYSPHGTKSMRTDNSTSKLYNEEGLVPEGSRWTLSFWVNAVEENGNWKDACGFIVNGVTFKVQKTDASPKAFQFFRYNSGNDGSDHSDGNLNNAVPAGNDWKHFVCICNEELTGFDVFADSVKVGSFAVENADKLQGFCFTSKTLPSGRAAWLFVDEVAIFNFALTMDEIAAIHAAEPTAFYPCRVTNVGADNKCVGTAQTHGGFNPIRFTIPSGFALGRTYKVTALTVSGLWDNSGSPAQKMSVNGVMSESVERIEAAWPSNCSGAGNGNKAIYRFSTPLYVTAGVTYAMQGYEENGTSTAGSRIKVFNSLADDKMAIFSNNISYYPAYEIDLEPVDGEDADFIKPNAFVYNKYLTTEYAETDWVVSSADELLNCTFGGAMAGANMGNKPNPSTGYFATKQDDSTVTFEMQVVDNQLKAIPVWLQVREGGKVWIKGGLNGESKSGYRGSGTAIGTRCFNDTCTDVLSGTTQANMGTAIGAANSYSVVNVYAQINRTKTVDGNAVWTTMWGEFAPKPGESATINVTDATTIELDVDVKIQNLTITGSGTLTFTGKKMTVANVIRATDSASGIVTFNNSETIFHTIAGGATTCSATISGSGKIVKEGKGVLTLDKANTYAGGTEIVAGTIKLDNAAGCGTGDINVCDGGTLDVNAKYAANQIYLAGDGVDGNGALFNSSNSDMGSGFAWDITLRGNASWGGAKYIHFGNPSNVKLNGYTFTKRGTNSFPMNNTTMHGPGKIVVVGGTFKNHSGNNTLDNIDLEISSGATLNLDGSSLTVNGFKNSSSNTISNNAELRVKGLIDMTATAQRPNKMKVFSTTTYIFPENEKSITLCNTALTLDSSISNNTVNGALCYIGDSLERVNLTYDTDTKSVSYTICEVATFDGKTYSLLSKALVAAESVATEENPQTVTLLAANDETIAIPENVIVETGYENKLTGTVSGSGTIRIIGDGTSGTSRAVPAITGLKNAESWTGTLEIASWYNQATIIKPSDYGNANSTFVFNGFKGFIHYEGCPYTFKAIEFKGDGFEGTGRYGEAPEIALKAKTITGAGTIKIGIASGGGGNFKLIGTESVNLTGALSSTAQYRLVLTKDASETLTAHANQTIFIGKGITIADAKKLTATNGLTGSGTVIYDAENTNTAPSFTVANTWTGMVWLKNLRASNYSSNMNQALATPATLNNLGKANSVIKMTNCAGYVNDGNNDSTFPWTLELDGDSAWENLSGWSSRNRSYAGLIGEGVLDFFGMNSHCSEVERFADASEFRGRINVGDETGANYKGKRVIIGSDNLPTGDSGQILISSGKTVTVANGKTWTANAMFVNGTIKGSGTIASALTFNDGAMIDLTDNASEVLKVAANKAVTFTGRVKVKGAALNDKVLSLGSGATLSASPTIILVDADGVETDGYSLAKADNGDVTIVVAETVATVNGVAYPSFAQAITAAASGDVKTIVVSRNFTAYNETIPAGVVIDLNGHEVDGRLDLKGGAYVKDGSVVKIDGNTTSFDIVFNDPAHPSKIDYEEIDVTLQYDTTATFKTEDSKVLGVYTKHHPYIDGLQNKTWFNDTDELTMAVVGVMPEFSETLKKRVFAHMGSSNNGLNGMFVSTGEKEDEVIICYNNAGTSHEITRMIVSNASTTPHSYVITKHDDPVGTPNRKATFTVYLDGQKRKTLAVNHFIISGGFQVGKPFGGGVSGFSGCSDNSSYISVLRIYDRAISLKEIQRYAEVYPYVSPNGSSARTFTESANWVGTGAEWTNTPKQGDPTHDAAPGIGAISATINAEATITMNLAEAKPAELLTVSGSGSVVFEKGEGDAKALTPADLTTSIPTTIKYGSLDISAANVTLLEGSSLTLDYTDYPVSDITAAKTIKVTGEIERDDNNVHLTPTHVPGYNFVLGYNTSLKQYEATISPDHTAGTKVYAANSSYTSFVLEDDTTTILFPNDKIVISSKGFSADSGRWDVNLNDQKLDGHQIVVDYPNGGNNPGITVSGDIRNGLNIEIAEGSIMYMRENKSIWTTTISGKGTYKPLENTVYLHGALTITAPVEMSGIGNFCLESDSTLTISEEASVKVTAYSGNQGFVKKTDNGDGTLTYSFEPGSEVITPSEDPDAPAVVIEDVGQGVKINPGADVIVPVGTDTSKIEVKYGDRVFNTGDDAIIDVVVNGTTGKIELSIKAEKEDEVRPTVTTMSAPTEESTDKVAFTITSPIPGLFYAVSSCDTPTGSFVDSTGDQATSDAAKTISIPMTFGENQKVKYYRVSVKATK